ERSKVVCLVIHRRDASPIDSHQKESSNFNQKESSRNFVDCCSSSLGRARGDLGRRAALWAPVPNGEFTTILVQRQCYTDLTVRTRNVPPSDVFSACVARQRIVLGRQALADKSNEITATPL